MNLYETLTNQCRKEIVDFTQKVNLAFLAPDSYMEDLTALVDSVVMDWMLDNGYTIDEYFRIDTARLIEDYFLSDQHQIDQES